MVNYCPCLSTVFGSISPTEKILIDKAIEMAKAFDSKIWLLHVAAPEPEFIGFGVGPQYIRDTRAEELRKEFFPNMKITDVPAFYQKPEYIKALSNSIKEYLADKDYL